MGTDSGVLLCVCSICNLSCNRCWVEQEGEDVMVEHKQVARKCDYCDSGLPWQPLFILNILDEESRAFCSIDCIASWALDRQLATERLQVK